MIPAMVMVVTDPKGTFTMGVLGLVLGVVVMFFHERLFFSKRRSPSRGIKLEKLFFQICGAIVALGGLYNAALSIRELITHR
jgi:hypothetical protein